VDAFYVNNKVEFKSGCFRVNGDTVDLFPAIETFDGVAYRIEFWGNEIDRISSFDPLSGREIDEQEELNVYPTNLFVTSKERMAEAIGQIDVDLGKQVEYFKEIGKPYEAKRLYERVVFDLEMIGNWGIVRVLKTIPVILMVGMPENDPIVCWIISRKIFCW